VRNLPFIIVALSFCTACSALAETQADLLKQLRRSIAKVEEENDHNSAPQRGEDSFGRDGERGDMGTYQRLQMSLDSEQFENLSELSALCSQFHSEQSREIAARLLELIKEARKAREEAQVTKLETALAKAKKKVLAAKKPADIDEVLDLLSNANDGLNDSRSQKLQSAGRKVMEAAEFAKLWQNYLFAMETSNDRAAYQAINALANRSGSTSVIPRSEILLRAPGEDALVVNLDASQEKRMDAHLRKIVAEIKTLDEIEPALERFVDIEQGNNWGGVQFEYSLRAIYKAYQEFKAGLPVDIDFDPGHTANDQELIPLKAQLILLLLPRYIENTELAKAGDTPITYLDRTIQKAVADENWILWVRARDAKRSLLNGEKYSQGLMQTDTEATRKFLYAVNLEKAGQFTMAYGAYRDALRGTEDAVPVEFIGKRLKAIESEHPEVTARSSGK
jgi:hypothetical protein